MFKNLKNEITDVNFIVSMAMIICLFVIMFVFIGKVDFRVMYFFVEIILDIMILFIFVSSVSIYKYTENTLILTVGIVYLFIGVFNFCSCFYAAYNQNSIDYLYKISASALYFESLSILFLSAVIDKKVKVKYFSISCFAITGAVIAYLYTQKYNLLNFYIDHLNGSRFFYINELILISICIISIWLFIHKKGKIKNRIVYYFIISLLFKIISILVLNFGIVNNLVWVTSMIFKTLSIYVIQNLVVSMSIINPYEKLFYKIKVTNKELNDKNIELEKLNVQLSNENNIRKSVSNVLLESSQRYMQILQMLPDAIFIHDNGKCTFVNNMGIKLLKIKNIDDIIGKDIVDFIHKDYRESAKERIDMVNRTGEDCQFKEEKIISTCGDETYVEAATMMFSKSSKLSISIVRDITEKKKNEESKRIVEHALYYDKIRKEFFANLSHELRTPLNIICSAMQLIKVSLENNDSEKVMNYFNMMNQNSYRLTKIINNLIDITKIDAGYFSVEFHNENIVSVVEDITMSVIEFVKSKGVDIIFDTDIEEKITAVDKDSMERIMLNLLSNAVKFTPAGGKIIVSVNDKKDSIEIRVKDNGIGIPDNMQQAIFERFIQVNKTFTREKEGSGIGLSIVKALVEMHGGTIRIDSKINVGSEFIIDLPIRLVSKDGNKLGGDDLNRKQKINIELSDL
ncbi:MULTISPECIES: MASE3 domain-containing sensor histidine kinase [Clostridium]|uniref:MASE3 domain-containing sensor histidine kinase n=1 Tax=Clostridium TaxID=1485 RepID=UPI000826981E|nr:MULTISPECIES: ATP-binding protein [Clostridium]PJI07434.1 PAS domain-containing sensor histidine kinase [Clostridium sp. CT7]